MATREEIEAQIASIDARLNSGAERVSYGSDSVAFNLEHLRKRKADLQRDLAAVDGTTRVRHIRTYSGRGY